MVDHIEELFQFLAPSAREDLKFVSLNHLVGMTVTEDGRTFFTKDAKFVESLIELTYDEAKSIQKLAYTALINLSVCKQISIQITNYTKKYAFLENLILNILDKNYNLADDACMLLANVTRTQECTKVVIDVITKLEERRDVIKEIVSILCASEVYNKHAEYHHLAFVLSNLSQNAGISQKFVNSGFLKKLIPFIGYKESVTRRRGVVAVVRNCCLNTAYHPQLLGADIDLLPSLLLPLAGPEEFDEEDNDKLPLDLQYLEPTKTREPDADIRCLLIESVNQLCATKSGRKFVKDNNSYVIFRELHKWEEDRRNSLALLNVVDILIGDEPAREHENLKSVDVPQELGAQFDQNDEEFMKD